MQIINSRISVTRKNGSPGIHRRVSPFQKVLCCRVVFLRYSQLKVLDATEIFHKKALSRS